ncbi:MurR/RpiR family transcriptional regulator [Oryzibacter oryziterrae]|uniref:MurR/RpiR family transcriptional regulator n=1 Tax=Oryzibacter oryziterrae TaxID=2766474 RepID=UPI001F170A63|nr:MurR/RpiR family transcriptional regulator [Oryzibacter oryziterrae]
MDDIVEALRQISESGSRSDQRLAGMVLSDIGFASRASIAELAERAEVSEPTVTRFCRTVGCDGIRDFKFHLAQALAIGGAYLTDGKGDTDDRTELDRICDSAMGAVERMRAGLVREPFALAAHRIAKASQVLVFGSGGSSTIAALETQHRLFRLGVQVNAYSDGQLQCMTASVADKKTVVVAFSLSGHAKSVIDAVEIARGYGAYTVAITAPGSRLAAAAEHAITFRIAEDLDLYKPSPSRYGLLVAVDYLAMLTAEAVGPAVLERLRRIKQSLNTYKVNDPSLPIGD